MAPDVLAPRRYTDTNNKIRFTLYKKSDGMPYDGLTHTSDSLYVVLTRDNAANPTAFYDSEDGLIETITTIGTWAAPSGGKCRFRQCNGPEGLYELQLSDSVFLALAGSSELRIRIGGAEDLEQKEILIPLANYKLDDIYDRTVYTPQYIPHIIVSVVDQLTFEVDSDFPDIASDFVGRQVLIENAETGGSCVRRITAKIGTTQPIFIIDAVCDFTVAVDDTFKILPLAFVNLTPISNSLTELLGTTRLLSTTVFGVTSSTEYVLADGFDESSTAFAAGQTVLFRASADSGQPSVRKVLSLTGHTLVIDAAPDSIINEGDSVQILIQKLGNTSGGGESGGGVLSGRVALSSLAPRKGYMEIVQGEEKVLTLIVEADGRFDNQSADSITVKFADPDGNVITKANSDVTRVTEELDVQVLRVTLSPANTNALEKGLLKIEVTFDTQKASFSHQVKIIEAL